MITASFKCASTLATQRIVAIESATANTVSYPGAETEIPIGITLDNSFGPASADQAVSVALAGSIAKLYMNQTCLVGNAVAADTSGRGVSPTQVSTGSYCLGVYLGPVIPASGTGTIGQVLVMPFWHQLG